MKKKNLLFSAIFLIITAVLMAGCFVGGNKTTSEPDSIIVKSISDSSLNHISMPSVCEGKDTVVIKKGGSLCRDLGMTKDQALEFAERYDYKHYYRNGWLIVLIHPGDTFVRDWRPL